MARASAAGGLMPSPGTLAPSITDEKLVGKCLQGDETAWAELVERYKNYVYSIIVRSGIDAGSAADVFQYVWLDVCKDLSKLRKQGAFRPWLTSVTLHRCYRWKDRKAREMIGQAELRSEAADAAASEVVEEPLWVGEIERQQLVRDGLRRLTSRCRELIRQLFFVQPSKPYAELASHLGVATGSIGFIRGRCLKRLRSVIRRLED
jgi:RNA polymerase sigma factor (sigma-70 family)